MATEALKYEFTAETKQFISGLEGMIGKLKQVEGEAGKSGENVSDGLKKASVGAEFLKGVAESLKGEFALVGQAAKLMAGGAVAAFAALGAAVVGAAVGMAAFAKSHADAAKEIKDLSKSSGISESSLRRLSVVTGKSGKDLKEITEAAYEAHDKIRDIEEPTDGAARALKSLGLNSGEIGKLLPLDQLTQLYDALTKVADPTERNRLANEILGQSYDDLKTKLGDAGKEGLALTTIQSELASAQDANAGALGTLNSAYDDLKKAMGVAGTQAGILAQQLLGSILPALTQIVQACAVAAQAIANVFAAARAGLQTAQVTSMVEGSGGKQRPGDLAGNRVARDVQQEKLNAAQKLMDDLPASAKTDAMKADDKSAYTARLNEIATKKRLINDLDADESMLRTQQNQKRDEGIKKDLESLKVRDKLATSAAKIAKADKEAGGGGSGGKKAGGGGQSDESKENDKLAARAKGLNDLYEPMQKLNRETKEFNELFAKGLISADVRDKAIAAATKSAEDRMKELNKSTDLAGKFMDDLKKKATSMTDTLIDGLVDGKKSFGEMISGMLKDIAKLALKSAINPLMENLMGGKGKMGGGGKAGGAGGLSSLMGGIGKKAVGGRADGLTLVGERGPELAAFGAGGGYVANATDTQRMMSQAAGNTNVSNIVVNVPQGTTPDQGAKIAKYMDQALEARIRKSQVDQRRAQPLRG